VSSVPYDREAMVNSRLYSGTNWKNGIFLQVLLFSSIVINYWTYISPNKDENKKDREEL
jgi:hypothetical protein